jgi:hypothetical protein
MISRPLGRFDWSRHLFLCLWAIRVFFYLCNLFSVGSLYPKKQMNHSFETNLRSMKSRTQTVKVGTFPLSPGVGHQVGNGKSPPLRTRLEMGRGYGSSYGD